MKINKYLVVVGLSLAATACSSIITFPETRNRQTIISHAESSEEAIKDAVHKAGRICHLENKSVKIIELDATYQGIDAKQRKLVDQAKTLLPKRKTSGNYVPSDYRYKGTLTFKCI